MYHQAASVIKYIPNKKIPNASGNSHFAVVIYFMSLARPDLIVQEGRPRKTNSFRAPIWYQGSKSFMTPQVKAIDCERYTIEGLISGFYESMQDHLNQDPSLIA